MDKEKNGLNLLSIKNSSPTSISKSRLVAYSTKGRLRKDGFSWVVSAEFTSFEFNWIEELVEEHQRSKPDQEMKSARSVDTQSFRSLATLLCEQNARHTLKRLLGNSRFIPNAKRRKLLCQRISSANLTGMPSMIGNISAATCNARELADTLIVLARLVT